MAVNRKGPVAKDAVTAVQAGLAAWTLLFLTFATFGPWFHIGVAYALTSGALLLSLVSLYLADRGYHSVWRNPGTRGVAHSGLAVALGLPALVVAAGYLGLHIAFLLPLVLVFFMIALVLGLVVFSERATARARGENFFRDWFDAPSQTSACGYCGDRTPLTQGRWARNRWLCPTCSTAFPGGLA